MRRRGDGCHNRIDDIQALQLFTRAVVKLDRKGYRLRTVTCGNAHTAGVGARVHASESGLGRLTALVLAGYACAQCSRCH